MKDRDEDATAPTSDHPTADTRAEGARPPGTGGRLPAGTRLGRYEILSTLGEGGMGIVYRARDLELGRDVALKLLADRRDDEGDAHREARLRREAQALAKLAHPNVVAIYDVGTSGTQIFLAAELVEGEDLSAWLRRRRRPWREVVAMLVQAGRGLAAAHAAGLVHRDFKPANVLIGADGRARVIDFGLARSSGASLPSELSIDSVERSGDQALVGASEASGATPSPSGPGSDAPSRQTASLAGSLTRVGSIMGTPPYMAPEQHRGEVCDARSDQFAFCVTAYYALHGERPFSGARYALLKAAVLAGEVRPPPRRSEVPRWLRRVLLRGLATEPGDRWPSMDALLIELGRDPARAWRRAALAALVALALAFGGIGWWRGQQQRAAAPAPCAGAGAPVAAVWNDARRASVERAVIATGSTHAPAVFANVAAAFDRRALRWAAMRVEACKATRVRGVQSDELLDLRMECLEQHRLDLAAEIELVAHADIELVQRLHEAPLSPQAGFEACADTESLRAAERLPADPALRARVTGWRETLARARALKMSGRFREALPLTALAAAGARVVDYRPLEAEALLERGGLEESLGEYAAASEDFTRAAHAALAGRRDDLAAEAWTDLVWLLSVREGRHAEAHAWARYAEAALERVPGRPRLRADLLRTEGVVYAAEKHWPEARAMAEAALATWRGIDPDDAAIGSTLTDLGDVARGQGRHDEALAYYQQALAAYERVLAADHPHIAAVLNNNGIGFRDVGRLPEALAAYERSLVIIGKRLGARHPMVAEVRTNLGVLLVNLGRPEEALVQYAEVIAIDAADDPDGVYVAIDRINRAEALVMAGRAGEGLAEATRAVERLRAAEGSEAELAAALEAQGDALTALGRPQQALAAHREAIGLLVRAVGPLHPDLAGPLVGEGVAQLALGRPERALAPLLRALSLRLQNPFARVPLAEVEFALARASYPAGGARRVAALELARAAAAGYRATAPTLAPQARAVEAWLARPE